MAYRLLSARGASISANGATAAVWWIGRLPSAAAGNFRYALRGPGDVFGFYEDSKTPARASMPLIVTTLSTVPVGGTVLVDEGTQFVVATVIADGTNVTGPDGLPIGPSARAAQLVAGQGTPSGTMKLIGVASDGSAWFQARAGQVVAGAISSLGALAASGATLAVETGGGVWVALNP